VQGRVLVQVGVRVVGILVVGWCGNLWWGRSGVVFAGVFQGPRDRWSVRPHEDF